VNSPSFSLIPLHGNGGGGFRFERMRPFIPPGVNFHPLTLPGFAAQPPDPSLTTLRAYAERLATLLAALPRPRVLLGHGIGGSLALELVQRQPGVIDALILHAAVGAKLDSRRFPWLMKLPGMRPAAQWAISTPLLRGMWSKAFFHAPVPADYLDQFFNEYRQCRVFGQMFDLITADWFNALQPVSLPSALLWGAEERILSTDQIAAFQALLPAAQVRVVPGWDHFPMIDQPEAYTREVLALAGGLVQGQGAP
jgi:pimeloyl-ACP methyl ester carboxylesterase